MFCGNCGKEIANDAKFCSHCGTTMENNVNVDVPKEEPLVNSNNGVSSHDSSPTHYAQSVAEDFKAAKKAKDSRNFNYGMFGFVGLIMIAVVAGKIFNPQTHKEPVSESIVEENKPMSYATGDAIKLGQFEITVSDIKIVNSVGQNIINEFSAYTGAGAEGLQSAKIINGTTSQKALEGGIFVAVQYKVKNVSRKPINLLFNNTSLVLLDSNNVEYKYDISATTKYESSLNIDGKFASYLNPGISETHATVFEVSKELLKTGKWYLNIITDGGDGLHDERKALVSINLK
jgi:hypothetical protein